MPQLSESLESTVLGPSVEGKLVNLLCDINEACLDEPLLHACSKVQGPVREDAGFHYVITPHLERVLVGQGVII
jgi:hypothetical protein